MPPLAGLWIHAVVLPGADAPGWNLTPLTGLRTKGDLNGAAYSAPIGSLSLKCRYISPITRMATIADVLIRSSAR